MTDLRVTKQHFSEAVKKFGIGFIPSGRIYDSIRDAGFVVVDKQALLKVKKDLEEIIDSQLMADAVKLCGLWVRERWLGQLSVCLELLEVVR